MGLASVTAACFNQKEVFLSSWLGQTRQNGVKHSTSAKKHFTMMTAVPELVGAPIFTFSIRGVFE